MILKLGRIKYINVDPVYYDFDYKQITADTYTLGKPDIQPPVQIVKNPPAVLNKMLAECQLDISPVSSSAFARNFDQWLILPDLSISCYGKVMSVLLVSHLPFDQLNNKKVFLTDESATAVDLLSLLFASEGIQPDFIKKKILSPGDISEGSEAGLVIGDSALKHDWHKEFEYVWDLCEMWNKKTGLPFVFAIWAVRKTYAQENKNKVMKVLEMLKMSKINGLKNISAIKTKASEKLGIDYDLCDTYFKSMHYELNHKELQCLSDFFGGLYAEKIIQQEPIMHFF